VRALTLPSQMFAGSDSIEIISPKLVYNRVFDTHVIRSIVAASVPSCRRSRQVTLERSGFCK
jgi:hypothetical protein